MTKSFSDDLEAFSEDEVKKKSIKGKGCMSNSKNTKKPRSNAALFERLALGQIGAVDKNSIKEESFDDMMNEAIEYKNSVHLEDQMKSVEVAGKMVDLGYKKEASCFLLSFINQFSRLDRRLKKVVILSLFSLVSQMDTFFIVGFLKETMQILPLCDNKIQSLIRSNLLEYGLLEHSDDSVQMHAYQLLKDIDQQISHSSMVGLLEGQNSKYVRSRKVVDGRLGQDTSSGLVDIRSTSIHAPGNSVMVKKSLSVDDPDVLPEILTDFTPSKKERFKYTGSKGVRLKGGKETEHDIGVLVQNNSVSVSTSFQHEEGLRIFKINPLHRIKSYCDQLQGLFDQGIKQICIVVPDSRFWVSSFYAKEAVRYFGDSIRVIDSKTYDLGLGLLVEWIVQNRLNHSFESLVLASESLVSKVRNWVVLGSLDDIKKTFWYKRARRVQKVAVDIGDTVFPVFAFHKDRRYVGSCVSFEGGWKKLLFLLEQDFQNEGSLPVKIIIRFSGARKEAALLSKALLSRFPDTEVVVKDASMFSFVPFQSHLSLGVLYGN